MPSLSVLLLGTVAAIYLGSLALLFYEHIGYPLLSLLLAPKAESPRKGTAPPHESNALPSITLIVPAHNEAAVIGDKLLNVMQLEYPESQLEVIVASDGSKDGTNEIVRDFLASHPSLNVRLLAFEERRGKASVLNDAVTSAAHDILCLCDANVMFQPLALKKLVMALLQPNVGAATGCVVLASEDANFGAGEDTYYSLERRLQSAESRLGSLMGVDGGMYVIHKNLFTTIPSDTILDDFVTSMQVVRAGRRVVYVPDAIANENGTPTGSLEFRRRVRISAGAAQVLMRGDYPRLSQGLYFWQFASHKLARWFGPIWLISLFASNLALVGMVDGEPLIGYWLMGSLAAQLLVYLLALASTFSMRLRGTRLGAISFYFVMSHVAIAIGFVKGLLQWQAVTWQPTERVTSTAMASKDGSHGP